MPKYVLERQYLLPIYQRLVVEADSLDEACDLAIEHDDWADAKEDNDNARGTTTVAVKRVPEEADPGSARV